MKFLDSARDTMRDVQDASTQVVETTSWATVALVSVAAVSLLALLLSTVALITRPRMVIAR